MPNRATIVHGWQGSPDINWFQWVGKELQKLGYTVDIPQMPNADNPKFSDWMETLEALTPNENTLLIGHSLANSLILRYLEKRTAKAKAAFLVAAWDWLMEDIKEYHQTFFETPFDYEAIKAKNIPITIVNSTNDPYIDFEQSKGLAAKLNATFIGIENAGHFNEKAGYTTFPQLFEILKERHHR